LGIYVVDIDGLKSGYYILFRNNSAIEEIKSYMKDANSFLWEQPVDSLPLYLLKEEEFEVMSSVSEKYSCHQQIAKHCSFHLTMFCPLGNLLSQFQIPVLYRYLHYECGMIGAILYLDAYAQGHTATGMGCYLDDISLEPFGLTNDPTLSERSVSPLYHFAIGVSNQDSYYQSYKYECPMAEFVKDYF